MALCLAFLFALPASADNNAGDSYGGDNQTNGILPSLSDIGQTKTADNIILPQISTAAWRRVAAWDVYLSGTGDSAYSGLTRVPRNTRIMRWQLYPPPGTDFDLGVSYGGVWWWSTLAGPDEIRLRVRPRQIIQTVVVSHEGSGTALLKITRR